MKTKLTLIAIALLAIAPFANAGFTFIPTGTVSPGDVAVQIGAVDITADTSLVIAVQGSGVLSGFALGAAAPADSGVIGALSEIGAGHLGQGEAWGMANFSASIYDDGIWLTANLLGGAVGDVVTAYESVDGVEFTEIGSFTVVPEPITVALMGLGGLFVARKKK